MTVAELIEHLQQCPQDLPVFVYDGDCAQYMEAGKPTTLADRAEVRPLGLPEKCVVILWE